MAHRISTEEMADAEGYATVAAMLEDMVFGNCPSYAVCSEWCTTEPDGICKHGFPSVQMAEGLL